METALGNDVGKVRIEDGHKLYIKIGYDEIMVNLIFAELRENEEGQIEVLLEDEIFVVLKTKFEKEVI